MFFMKKIIGFGRRFGVAVLAIVSLIAFVGCGHSRSARRAAARSMSPPVVQAVSPVPSATSVANISAPDAKSIRVLIQNHTKHPVDIVESIDSAAANLRVSKLPVGQIVDIEIPARADGVMLIAQGVDSNTNYVGSAGFTAQARGSTFTYQTWPSADSSATTGASQPTGFVGLYGSSGQSSLSSPALRTTSRHVLWSIEGLAKPK